MRRNGYWFYDDDEKFINKLIDKNINGNSLLIIDAAIMVENYYQEISSSAFILEYEIYDKDNNLLYRTPDSIVWDHRYPNRGYLTLTQKCKNNLSNNGCYIVDTAKKLNKIRKIIFKLSTTEDKENKVKYIFNLEPKYKNNEINKINFRLVLSIEPETRSSFLFEVVTPNKDGISAHSNRIEVGMFGTIDDLIVNDKDKSVEFTRNCKFKAFEMPKHIS